jgi:magnesium transporter
MARFLNSRKESIGQSPFDLQFTGEQKVDKVQWHLISYDKRNLIENELTGPEEYRKMIRKSHVNWLNIDGLHDVESLGKMGDLDEDRRHMMANVLDTHARPKLITYNDAVLISIKKLQYQEEDATVSSENLSLIISGNELVSFQERHGSFFDPVRERIRRKRKVIRELGTDYLAYTLLDLLVDEYIHIISRIGERIEDLDDELISHPSTASLEKINSLKAEINYLRKAVIPCREIVFSLKRVDNGLIHKYMSIHLSELESNVELAIDSVNNYREILSDELNLYHTIMAQKLNDILKTLTIFSVIFIPLTFIAGIYGMNFKYMPELDVHYGYYYMLGLMALIGIGMMAYFKFKKWY